MYIYKDLYRRAKLQVKYVHVQVCQLLFHCLIITENQGIKIYNFQILSPPYKFLEVIEKKIPIGVNVSIQNVMQVCHSYSSHPQLLSHIPRLVTEEQNIQ